MIDISKGRYWDLPWSLISGCTPCSLGCEHCWSAAITHRFENHSVSDKHSQLGPFVLTYCNGAGRFTGKIITHSERLIIPLKRRNPTVYAIWNDLFHEEVPVNFLEDSLAVMTQCPQHTFLALTKRAQRLNLMTQDRLRVSRTDTWPIQNLYLGITVCNQQEADEKIPIFLQVPGKKFLSIEPMLGEIDLRILNTRPFPPYGFQSENALQYPSQISAVILGGETGPGARPLHPDWVRSVRDQCANAGVPFFFKQWGEWIEYKGDIPSSTNRFTFPGGREMIRVGRKNAGRLIDGRTHDELPWRVAH